MIFFSRKDAKTQRRNSFAFLCAFACLQKAPLALFGSTALLLGSMPVQAEDAKGNILVKAAQAAAQQDILDWNYRYKVIGHPAKWEQFLINALDSSYSLEIIEVKPGSASETKESIAAYNKVICNALNKRYGYDVLERETSRAKRHYVFYQQGAKEASRDLKRGVLKIQAYGATLDWAEEYDALLLKKYGVIIERQGCVVDIESDGISQGYNEVMTSAIIEKFGHNVVADEAKKFVKPESPLHMKGHMDAERDFADGKLKLFSSRNSTPWEARYCDLLTARFGIEILDLEWMKQQSLDEYCWGYDDVVEKAVKTKFGPKAIDRINQQAQRDYNLSLK